MKKLIKAAAYIMFIMILIVAFVSCTNQESVETKPHETIAPEETTSSQEVRVDVHFSIVDQDGNAIPQAVITVIPSEVEGESATLNADSEGKSMISLTEGMYTVRFDVLPEFVLGIDTDIRVYTGMEPITLTVTDNTPNGTQERPFVITESSTQVNIPAGVKYYFTLFGGNNRTLTVSNPQAEITYKDAVYKPDNTGLIEVRMTTDTPRDPSFFALSNSGNEDCTMTIVIQSDPGAMDNPIEITELGSIVTAQVPQDGIVYYMWTATSSGTLSVNSTDAINNISLNNQTTSQVSNFTEGKEKETLMVSEGDVIMIVVSVLGGDKNADFLTVTFSLTMEE